MKRSRPRNRTQSLSSDAGVISLVVGRDGVVRLDESGTNDLSYGKRLAERLSSSLSLDGAAEVRECRGQTTWSTYEQMLRSSTPRYERSRPRDFGIGNCIPVSPGRKEPKRGS